MKYADITDRVMLFGIQQQIEIWSIEEYEKMISQEPEDFSQIADEIFGNSVNND